MDVRQVRQGGKAGEGLGEAGIGRRDRDERHEWQGWKAGVSGMKERRGRDVRQGIRKGRQERLEWKTGETGLENRIGRDGKTEEAGTEERIAGKEERRSRAGKHERNGWKTAKAGMEDRRSRSERQKQNQGWTKEEVGMTSKKDGRMSKWLNVNVRESKRVDQKSISHKQQHCTRTKKPMVVAL